MIVADAGPIIVFARIGRLELLRLALGEIIIPQAVYEELIGQGGESVGALEIARRPWIQWRTLADLSAVTSFPAYLHSGEREAIILAQQLRAQLLLEERRGRNFAAELGIEVFGSLRVLVEAKEQGFIEEVRPLVEAMLDAGYWIDADLISSLLQTIGE